MPIRKRMMHVAFWMVMTFIAIQLGLMAYFLVGQ